jgi:hypothetical protein
VSERLWTPPVDERRETYSDLISDREAVAVVSVLSAHHERIDPWSVERLAALGREQEYDWRWEVTTVLVTGALALGARTWPSPVRCWTRSFTPRSPPTN